MITHPELIALWRDRPGGTEQGNPRSRRALSGVEVIRAEPRTKPAPLKSDESRKPALPDPDCNLF